MKLYFNTDPIVYDPDYQPTMIEKAATWFWFGAFFPPYGENKFFYALSHRFACAAAIFIFGLLGEDNHRNVAIKIYENRPKFNSIINNRY